MEELTSKRAEGDPTLQLGVTKTEDISEEYFESLKEELNFWFGTKEEGSTSSARNTVGDAYLTYAIEFTAAYVLEAITIFKRDIDRERSKTGTLSVRIRPCFVLSDQSYHQPVYQIRARVVAYYGATPDFDW